ncbi:hypothetical protein HCN44_000978 [Aphidius gifuensis]|uniref:L-lactate dehydrogenase n=1 Tax=Aphidius gifuensis TaxID=684658 RepID=A0A834XNE6_APHGI|nr:hypothetical protein HCN44_000978 [Aphidius gifuensis]
MIGNLTTCFRSTSTIRNNFFLKNIYNPSKISIQTLRSKKIKKLLLTDYGKRDAKRSVSFEPIPCLREELLCKVSNPTRDGASKVTIGNFLQLVTCKISSHVAIVDAFPKKLEGEGMDYRHGSVFLDDARIEYDTDFCVSHNSKVVIIAAGVRQIKGETRLDLVQRNADIIKNIVPPLVEHSPNAVFIIVSNPVDILSWVTWKVSGLPAHKIIGSGCHLDTARFRYMIAERIGVAAKSVHGFVIGEHGDTQVPLWSGVNIAGVLFRDILPNVGLELDEEGWNEMFKDVIRAGPTVRCLKGYSNTAVGLSVADITKAILRNTHGVKSISTLVQGHHGICHEIYLSLPCVIGENGVTEIIRMRLTEYEKKLLQNSSEVIHNIQKDIKPT